MPSDEPAIKIMMEIVEEIFSFLFTFCLTLISLLFICHKTFQWTKLIFDIDKKIYQGVETLS